MHSFSVEEARRFCAAWLPAWTGNDAERLASFYTEDACYLDPGIPQGLIRYFKKLLGNNPAWVWQHLSGVPLEDGFLNQWRASVPVGNRVIDYRGVCSVQVREGLI